MSLSYNCTATPYPILPPTYFIRSMRISEGSEKIARHTHNKQCKILVYY
uniref:Uncharacterized protein n=1 Tax=Arundo donax TaxID=35708 RepID=A0A0A9ANC8_ARUDO